MPMRGFESLSVPTNINASDGKEMDMETQTVNVTLFVPPRGERREIGITKVLPEDAQYIKEHNIKVSMEELMTGDNVVYFDDGTFINNDPDESPDEIVIISKGGKKTCEECFKEGVERLKARAK